MELSDGRQCQISHISVRMSVLSFRSSNGDISGKSYSRKCIHQLDKRMVNIIFWDNGYAWPPIFERKHNQPTGRSYAQSFRVSLHAHYNGRTMVGSFYARRTWLSPGLALASQQPSTSSRPAKSWERLLNENSSRLKTANGAIMQRFDYLSPNCERVVTSSSIVIGRTGRWL